MDVSVDLAAPLDHVGDVTEYFHLVSASAKQSGRSHRFWVSVHVAEPDPPTVPISAVKP